MKRETVRLTKDTLIEGKIVKKGGKVGIIKESHKGVEVILSYEGERSFIDDSDKFVTVEVQNADSWINQDEANQGYELSYEGALKAIRKGDIVAVQGFDNPDEWFIIDSIVR